jgi:hypothetical protein
VVFSGYTGEHSEIFGVRIMVFNATLNTISDLSKRSVLLVEETGVSGENQPSRKETMLGISIHK